MSVRVMAPLSAPYQDGGLARHYGAAVYCRISHSCGWLASDEHGGRSQDDRVGWSYTDAHVSCDCGRLASDKYSRAAGSHDGSAHMGYRGEAWCQHRANVHISDPGCWFSHCFIFF